MLNWAESRFWMSRREEEIVLLFSCPLYPVRLRRDYDCDYSSSRRWLSVDSVFAIDIGAADYFWRFVKCL